MKKIQKGEELTIHLNIIALLKEREVGKERERERHLN